MKSEILQVAIQNALDSYRGVDRRELIQKISKRFGVELCKFNVSRDIAHEFIKACHNCSVSTNDDIKKAILAFTLKYVSPYWCEMLGERDVGKVLWDYVAAHFDDVDAVYNKASDEEGLLFSFDNYDDEWDINTQRKLNAISEKYGHLCTSNAEHDMQLELPAPIGRCVKEYIPFINIDIINYLDLRNMRQLLYVLSIISRDGRLTVEQLSDVLQHPVKVIPKDAELCIKAISNCMKYNVKVYKAFSMGTLLCDAEMFSVLSELVPIGDNRANGIYNMFWKLAAVAPDNYYDKYSNLDLYYVVCDVLERKYQEGAIRESVWIPLKQQFDMETLSSDGVSRFNTAEEVNVNAAIHKAIDIVSEAIDILNGCSTDDIVKFSDSMEVPVKELQDKVDTLAKSCGVVFRK